MECCPEGPDTTGQFGRVVVPPQKDHRATFRDQFAELVAASGMSTRDIARQTGVSKSTIGDWKNGKALPQDRRQLDKVAQVLITAAGDSATTLRIAQRLAVSLRDAKEERDARSARSPTRVALPGPGPKADRQARSTAAVLDAMKAFMRLRNLDTMPDWQRELASYSGRDSPEPTPDEETAVVAWNRQRDDLLSDIELAALMIDDEPLRARLKEAIQMVKLWNGPMRHTRQSEQRTRWVVASDALEALGAYTRDEPLPARSADYRNTKEFVDLYIEEWEMNSGH